MFFMTQVLCQTLRSVLCAFQTSWARAAVWSTEIHESECLKITHAVPLLFNPNDAFLDTPQYSLGDVSEAAPKHPVPNELYR